MQKVADRLVIQAVLQFGDEKIAVTDTKKENNLIIHFTDKLPADISLPVTASVNWEDRDCR